MDIDARALTCPITFALFTDPVMLRDGNTYERSAVEKLILDKGGSIQCPLDPSKRCMDKTDMLPNHSMKSLVNEFMWKNPRHELVKEAVKEKKARDLKKSEEIMKTVIDSLNAAAKLGNPDATNLLSQLKKKRKAES